MKLRLETGEFGKYNLSAQTAKYPWGGVMGMGLIGELDYTPEPSFYDYKVGLSLGVGKLYVNNYLCKHQQIVAGNRGFYYALEIQYVNKNFK